MLYSPVRSCYCVVENVLQLLATLKSLTTTVWLEQQGSLWSITEVSWGSIIPLLIYPQTSGRLWAFIEWDWWWGPDAVELKNWSTEVKSSTLRAASEAGLYSAPLTQDQKEPVSEWPLSSECITKSSFTLNQACMLFVPEISHAARPKPISLIEK